MKSKKIVVLVLLLALVASGAIAEKIPSGSHATVRLNTSLSSATAHTGEVWSGTLTHDVVEHFTAELLTKARDQDEGEERSDI